MDRLAEFTEFLKKVDLKKYREQYSKIKIVEMDLNLSRDTYGKFNVSRQFIQAINLLYKIYWEEKKFISFDEFYKIYLEEKKKLLEEFRKDIGMCDVCFYKGIKARIYRTWTGLITQIHAGYVAQKVFGENSVYMSRELDSMGADIQVRYKSNVINYQVKKESYSGVKSGKPEKVSKELEGVPKPLYYEVPNSDVFDNPKTKKGEFKTQYKRFIEDKRIERLSNGFIIFTEEAFIGDKKEIDKL
jgi:hypothetical protein